jgi:3-methyl-2-oxobutanoate hydroxymethyltransferase
MKEESSWESLKGRIPAPVFVTAYDAAFARLARDAGADGLIVGDTVGPLALGHASAEELTYDEMRHHAAAVRRGAGALPVMADLPLKCLDGGGARAADDGCRLVNETGIHALKVEGATAVILQLVEQLSTLGVSVVGHLEGSGGTLIDDARRLERAGVVAIVLVGMDAGIAAAITRAVRVPTLGKSAGADCDGQIVNAYQALGIVASAESSAAAAVRNMLRDALLPSQ